MAPSQVGECDEALIDSEPKADNPSAGPVANSIRDLKDQLLPEHPADTFLNMTSFVVTGDDNRQATLPS